MRDQLKLLIYDLRAKCGWRMTAIVVLVAAAGLTEGIGILLLVPLFNIIGIGDPADGGMLSTLVDTFVRALGVPLEAWSVLGLIVLVFTVQSVLFLTQSALSAALQHRYTNAWARDISSAYLHADWSFFLAHKTGELTNTLIGEVNRLSNLFFVVLQLLAAAIIAGIYIGLAFAVSWQSTLVLVGLGVLLMVAVRGFVRWGHRIGQDVAKNTAELQVLSGEFLGGAKLVKATSTEDRAQDMMFAVLDRLRGLNFWVSFQPNMVRSVFEFTTIVTISVVLVYGITEWSINPAHILVSLALFMRLYPRLSSVQQNIQALGIYLPAIQSTTDAVVAARAVAETLNDSKLPFAGEPVGVRIENVSLSYGDNAVLKGIDLEIPKCKTVAIVGPSGAGKSTLVDCLLGLAQPQSGTMSVEGVELKDLALRAWRRSVGYVGQDTILFNASIADNLAWGREGVTREQIEYAAKHAFAHDFIEDMPAGYDTSVGDRGVRLSGGQIQRLGLARALVGQPSLLILDEATSALDTESESMVLKAIEKLRGEMSIITIAHRLSTVRNADVIYFIENGQVVEQGDWETLLGQSGRFASFWQQQSQRY